jgi:hypothetical protein
MPAMAVPLAADKLEAWEAWLGDLTGARKADFDDLNARHGLTEHRAYLQAMPDGDFLVVVVHEGPGANDFMARVMESDHEFDRWFVAAVAEVHGIDPSDGPLPPVAERRL